MYIRLSVNINSQIYNLYVSSIENSKNIIFDTETKHINDLIKKYQIKNLQIYDDNKFKKDKQVVFSIPNEDYKFLLHLSSKYNKSCNYLVRYFIYEYLHDTGNIQNIKVKTIYDFP